MVMPSEPWPPKGAAECLVPPRFRAFLICRTGIRINCFAIRSYEAHSASSPATVPHQAPGPKGRGRIVSRALAVATRTVINAILLVTGNS